VRRPGWPAPANVSTYLLNRLDVLPRSELERLVVGNDRDALLTNVAHLVDLRSPAVTVQTSGVTGLIKIVQSLRHELLVLQEALAGHNPDRQVTL
jgi:hypothetical protein